MVRLDKESVLRLYCYCREAERSLHRALTAPWAGFRAYYGTDKAGAIRSFREQLARKCPGACRSSPLPDVGGVPGMPVWRLFVRYWFGRWLARWEKQWSFPEDELCITLAGLDALLGLLDAPARPDADVLIGLRMHFYNCQRFIGHRCLGLPDIEKAARIDHFDSSPTYAGLQLSDILKDCA
jgi:hypothetical protein